MARTVRDQNLQSREARGRLKARGKPYYRLIEKGLHLGYRKPKEGVGQWVVRHYVGDQAYAVKTIAPADDRSDADGLAILDFPQAQAKARDMMVSRANAVAGKHGPLTVAVAIEAYLDFLSMNRKTASDARYRAEALILPKLGNVEVGAITTDMIERWLRDVAKSAPRLRTRKGEKQQYREPADDDDALRRRKSTANRTLTILKAALNRAWRAGRVPSDDAWRRVEPFEEADAARVRYLTIGEAKRLINACDPEFRTLVQAALVTGARYGELAALRAADFNPNSGTVQVRTSKSGKGRHVVLADEGASLFKSLAVGRPGGSVLLPKVDGSEWLKSHQSRPMAEACERAKIDPPISFHVLRHTYASLAIMNGAPLLVVAKNLGHSDTRMVEKHYGHLAPSYIADAIRAAAPKFGIKPDSNVAVLPR
jgi:integrase